MSSIPKGPEIVRRGAEKSKPKVVEKSRNRSSSWGHKWGYLEFLSTLSPLFLIDVNPWGRATSKHSIMNNLQIILCLQCPIASRCDCRVGIHPMLSFMLFIVSCEKMQPEHRCVTWRLCSTQIRGKLDSDNLPKTPFKQTTQRHLSDKPNCRIPIAIGVSGLRSRAPTQRKRG